jgi:hypothetical protein
MACSVDALGESRPQRKKYCPGRGAGTEFVGGSKLAAVVPLVEAGVGAPEVAIDTLGFKGQGSRRTSAPVHGSFQGHQTQRRVKAQI